jgi:hypothetical protein
MKSLAIIGFAVGTVLAGCASTSGARSEPTTSAVHLALAALALMGTSLALLALARGTATVFAPELTDVATHRDVTGDAP